jgi:N-acetylneuraminic acid mutarotase
MNRLRIRGFRFALACVLVAPAAAASASGPGAGTWSRLAAAPIAPNEGGVTSVWTGKRMLVFGRVTTRAKNGAVLGRVDVAAAYDPATRMWRRLPPLGPTSSFMDYGSVWTGKEMLVWGQGARAAFDPTTNRWRRLPGSPLLSIHDGYGIVVWTGREMIGWGGGCCGDAFSDGVAYDPRTNRWRALARAPLAGSQDPIGAWTGRELILFVGGIDPDGKPWPARLARAAAYDPRTDTWRRIAPLPASRGGASAVWDGREVLVVGGGGSARAALPRVGFAYDPKTNRWRRLPPMASGRIGAAALWTGKRLLLWGGATSRESRALPARGLVYDPKTNRWSPLPRAPLRGRLDPAAVWTGRAMIVWGGASADQKRLFADGAAFRPASR